MNKLTQVIILTFSASCLIWKIKAQGTLGDNCVPGELYEGPTCSTFTKCVGSRFFNLRIKFDCPPGTYFDTDLRLCNHDYRNLCQGSGPTPPSPFVSIGKPIGGANPPAPGPSGPPGVQNYPQIPAEVVCPQYDVDITGVYDCPEPGFFPSYGDCHTFYRCINSMGCLVKGFYTSCPPNYLFDGDNSQCTLEDIVGPCTKVQDPSLAVKISPVIQLTERNMKEFFKISEYWRFMKFMPQESQRIIFPDNIPHPKNNLVPNIRKNVGQTLL